MRAALWMVVVLGLWATAPQLRAGDRIEEPADLTRQASRVPDLSRPSAATARPQRTDTAHLTFTTSASAPSVAPGTRFSLFVDITPKPKMHVYSPPQTEYIPIALTLDADDAVKVWPAAFPKPEKYLFEPLNETQLVFSKPFRIVQDITIATGSVIHERAASVAGKLTITGSLQYQACDDKVCYMPQTIPLSWTVALKPSAR